MNSKSLELYGREEQSIKVGARLPVGQNASRYKNIENIEMLIEYVRTFGKETYSL